LTTARSIGCGSYSDRPNADRDNRTTANAVARQLGITDVEAEVLPDQKSAVVAKLQKAGRGDLGGIVRARRLSQATMSNIRQNLFFAFIHNAAGTPIDAGILYPTFGLLLSPVIAAAAMALSSVGVVGDALRLRVSRL